MSPARRLDVERIAAIVSQYSSDARPGIAMGVAHRGKTLLRQGFGLASVELPVALSPTIRMRIGSTSKHFCALAVMLLQEEARLDIDDCVRRHVPELPPWADAITLRHLLTHTSGMRCNVDVLRYLCGAQEQPVSTRAQLELLCDLRSVNFEPGADFMYCNAGYLLLSEVVERVASEPFASFLARRIFAPVGMHDTLVREGDNACVPNSASLHVRAAGDTYTRGVFGLAIRGEGGIVSTVDDMLRWFAHMDAPQVGTAATWAAMRTPATLASGNTTGYGFGLMAGHYRGARVLHHSGAVAGGSCQMVKLPDHGLDIIVMSNDSAIDAGGIANSIIDACVEGLLAKPEAVGDACEGAFIERTTGRVLRFLPNESGALHAEALGARIPVMRGAQGAWQVRASPAFDANIAVSGDVLEWRDPAGIARWDRLRGDALPPAPGRYDGSEFGVDADITAGSDGALLRLRSAHGEITYALEPFGGNVWKCTHHSTSLRLAPWVEIDGDDILFSTARTRRARLVRA